MTATTKRPSGLMRATTSFAGPDNLQVAEGEVFDASDPIVKARPALFAPVDAGSRVRA